MGAQPKILFAPYLEWVKVSINYPEEEAFGEDLCWGKKVFTVSAEEMRDLITGSVGRGLFCWGLRVGLNYFIFFFFSGVSR